METAVTSGLSWPYSISWTDKRAGPDDCSKLKSTSVSGLTLNSDIIYIYHVKHKPNCKKECKSFYDLHIQSDKYFHHEEEHGHFHDKLHQQIFQVFLIFHMHVVGEVCCPPHQLLQFEAMGEQ